MVWRKIKPVMRGWEKGKQLLFRECLCDKVIFK